MLGDRNCITRGTASTNRPLRPFRVPSSRASNTIFSGNMQGPTYTQFTLSQPREEAGSEVRHDDIVTVQATRPCATSTAAEEQQVGVHWSRARLTHSSFGAQSGTPAASMSSLLLTLRAMFHAERYDVLAMLLACCGPHWTRQQRLGVHAALFPLWQRRWVDAALPEHLRPHTERQMWLSSTLATGNPQCLMDDLNALHRVLQALKLPPVAAPRSKSKREAQGIPTTDGLHACRKRQRIHSPDMSATHTPYRKPLPLRRV